ncbi:MAG: DUF3910 family protein [Bacillus cereus]|jgi:3D (Asp-Asp-Asp) domain-containing protein|nr:DUF3910 family protein [Bacillus cereus]
MNVQAKVDWIGTPKPYIYKDEVTYDATSIDFSLAGDTGGAIKGNRIDVLVGSDAAANKWGRKSVKVKILK